MPDFDLISDLHLDMRKNPMRMLTDIEPTSSTLLIAGDLCEARNVKAEWLDVLSEKYGYIYAIMGNHEYYGSTMEDAERLMLEVTPPNMKYLFNELEYCIDKDITIAGTTLWFPNQPENLLHKHRMNDFSYIANFEKWVYQEHSIAKSFLSQIRADVWMMHHLPFLRSVHPRYKGDQLNRFFVGDISNEFTAHNEPPRIIVHGHTHEPFDYMVGDTRVVCNPLGYPGEGNNSIIPKLVSFAELV